MAQDNDTGAQLPSLRVARGNPDDAELAAVSSVLATLACEPADASPTPTRSRWADRTAAMRPPPRPGPDAWRASGLPY